MNNNQDIAPERLDRFTTKAGDLRELTPEEVEQTLTPAQAVVKHNAMMKQKYGDEMALSMRPYSRRQSDTAHHHAPTRRRHATPA